MAAFDVDEQYQRALDEADDDTQRVEAAPTSDQKLGSATVVCLVLNRTIGSGIFVTPSYVLEGTGSVGASLMFWAIGGVFAICGLLTWLELGLSVPLRRVTNDEKVERSVPQSGGEKNYIEFIFTRKFGIDGKPALITTCMYGTVFVLLGNLSGNAIAFGQLCYEAAGRSDAPRGPVIGLAITVLTACMLLHIFSRRGGIRLNNVFAVLKVALLLAIIILGFIKAGGARLGGDPNATSDFKPSASFRSNRRDAVSYTDSLLYIMYTYSGFEQPFYVLSEVKNPRKVFPKATGIAMGIAIFLFVLVNVAYFCAVPKDVQLDDPQTRMATLFLGRMFGDEGAQRAMAALIAISIFGNILVMTFTAARVKQEIAKEGIWPYSLFFGTSHASAWAWIKTSFQSSRTGHGLSQQPEPNPIPALGLHWLSSIFLIAVTSMLQPPLSYNVLVSLYSYVVIVGFGFVVSGGLLYITFNPSRNWSSIAAFRPFPYPLHALIYFIVCGVTLFAAFGHPSASSPYSTESLGFPWWLVPAIGQSTWLWGLVWFLGLKGVMGFRGRRLRVTRVPFVIREDGEWVTKFEIVTHELEPRVRVRHDPRNGDVEMEVPERTWDEINA